MQIFVLSNFRIRRKEIVYIMHLTSNNIVKEILNYTEYENISNIKI